MLKKLSFKETNFIRRNKIKSEHHKLKLFKEEEEERKKKKNLYLHHQFLKQ